MGWTIAFIVIFSIAALVPAIWSIVGLARGDVKYWPGVAGTGFALLLMLFTVIAIAANWGECDTRRAPSSEEALVCERDGNAVCHPDVWAMACGEARGCRGGTPCPAGSTPVYAYCEKIEPGRVMQPWATWSDLSFIAAGIWLLWWMQRFPAMGRRGSVEISADNPMITRGFLSVTYGMVVVFMGPPSMWYHASMKGVPGWFDSFSVVLWLGFNASYVLYALCFTMWGWGRGSARPVAVLGFWAALSIGLGIGMAEGMPSLVGFGVTGGLWGLAEVIYVSCGAGCSAVKYRRTWWLFICNLALLAVTMGIWLIYNPGVTPMDWCKDLEVFPGHALFHILASCSCILTYVSFSSEQRIR